jgi:glycosyltransferase involved in cell wall biosynthesis
MKVLVFSSAYPNNIWPNHGIFIKERMTHFARLTGCDIEVIAPVPYFPPLAINRRWLFSQVVRREVVDGICVHHPNYLMTPKIGMTLYGLEMFLSVLPTVKTVQRKFDFDLISAHTVYPDGFAGVLLGAYLKKPVIVSARGSDINVLHKLPLIRRLLRFTLARANAIIAVADKLKRTMVELGIPESKITTIANGVNSKIFHPISQEMARKRLKLPNKRIILSVGNLTSNKGFDLLIKSVEILRSQFGRRDIHLAIVGDGVGRTALAKMIRSMDLDGEISLVGSVNHSELPLWYSAADVFCLASKDEGWPNVIMESLACGTPVVATRVGGIPEIIDSKEIGYLVKRDESEIARAIQDSLQKAWRTEVIVGYARQHSWCDRAVALRHVFETVLGRMEVALALNAGI